MKRFFSVILALALVVGFVAADVHAATRYYEAKVYKIVNDFEDPVEINSGITYQVLAIDSDTEETLYSDMVGTSKTNAVTASVFNTHDRIDFYCDPTDATSDLYVDLIVVDTSGGYTVFVEDFSPYDRRIIIDERPNVKHIGCIWWEESDTAETDTGVDFDTDVFVHRVWVETVTNQAGQTLDVGLLSSETSGDADGFCNDASCASAAFVDCTEPTITVGTTEEYVSTASVIGALLGKSKAGSDTAYDEGYAYNWSHAVTGSNAVSLVYSCGTSVGSAAGYIFYEFTRVR